MDGAGKIVIRLTGEPQAKGRHRSRMVETKDGRRFIGNYPDPATAKYESHLRLAAQQAMDGRDLLRGQVLVHVVAFVSIPTSMPEWKKEMARARVLRPTAGRDWDNYGKICDALNKVVWVDDAQIVRGVVDKFYSDVPELVVIAEEQRIPTRDEWRAEHPKLGKARPSAPEQPALALEASP